MRAALLLAASLLSLPGRADDPPLAPDGRRGFGGGTPLTELLRQFRTPDDEEQAMQTELRDVVRDVTVLVSVTEGFYRERGYFDLLDPLADPTLDALHREFGRYVEDPGAIAPRGDQLARTFARMFLDTRFRVRFELLSGWRHEAAQVSGGLEVLRAAAHGFVTLDDVQGGNVARRIDLAGSVLRALRNDLTSLREPMDTAAATGVAPEAVDEFLGLFDIGDRGERERRIGEALSGAETSRDRMGAILFRSRLQATAAVEFEWRAEMDERAGSLLDAARVAFPTRGEQEAPREIERLSKSRRRRLARENAVLGLTFDPLDDELAWIAAETSYVIYGQREGVSHYDRFLALRGVVHYDDRTYRGRKLSEREKTALYNVQEYERLAEGDQ
jgi:hypothetical protein